MSHKIPNIDPRMHKHFIHAVHEERVAILSLLKFQWHFVSLVLLGIAILVYLSHPFPPTHIRLATGQPNSSLDLLGKKYAEYFKQNGVQLELVPSAGAIENTELLKRGKVDAAFSLGGESVGSDAANIVSLGSVEYQPLWLFYRGDEYDGSNPSIFFGGKTFSVNIPGSGTHQLTEKILSMHGIDVNKSSRLISLSSQESVKALLSGKIDGVFLVAGLDSKTIQSIIADPKMRIFNFTMADAYVKRLRFLETLNLPRGSIDLRGDVPPKNTQMVATTTTILANNNLHPAIQHLFLNGAHKIDDSGQTFFTRPGRFPAYTDRDVPASAVAERYYDKGPPALNGYASYWIASFIDRIWFTLFAIVAIVYPLTKIVPNYRSLYAHLCLTDSYDNLAEIDLHMTDDSTPDELQALLGKVAVLENRINQLWVPSALKPDFYNLRNSVEIVRVRAARLQNSNPPDTEHRRGQSPS